MWWEESKAHHKVAGVCLERVSTSTENSAWAWQGQAPRADFSKCRSTSSPGLAMVSGKWRNNGVRT